MPILDIDRAGKVFGSGQLQVIALDGVSLAVDAGEFVAIMGPSGSGKSTLLQLAGGLDRPTSGRVLLSGRDLARMGAAELAQVLRHQIGFVFQSLNLLASLTAAENVALPLELDGVRPRTAMSKARSLLESVGLLSVADRFPNGLSGGEQQRVAIARAVVGGRSLLLADEPTGALDSLSGESVMKLLRQRAPLAALSSWSLTTSGMPPGPTGSCSSATAGSPKLLRRPLDLTACCIHGAADERDRPQGTWRPGAASRPRRLYHLHARPGPGQPGRGGGARPDGPGDGPPGPGRAVVRRRHRHP